MCREAASSTAQQLLSAINGSKLKDSRYALGFGLCFVWSFFPPGKPVAFAKLPTCIRALRSGLLPRSLSKWCLCPSLSSLTVAHFKGLMGNTLSLFSPCAQELGETPTPLAQPSLSLKGFCSRGTGRGASGSAASTGASQRGRLICTAAVSSQLPASGLCPAPPLSCHQGGGHKPETLTSPPCPPCPQVPHPHIP